jgi:hypothetical protein
MIRGEARDAYHNDYDDSEPRKRMSDYLDDICWSGVCAFTLSDLSTGRELQEVIGDLNTMGIAYLAR